MIDLEQIIEQVVRRVLAEQTTSVVPQMLTVAAYAAAKSIAQSTVRAAIKSGRLEHERVGRAVRIPATAEIKPRAAKVDDVTASAAVKLGLVRGGR